MFGECRFYPSSWDLAAQFLLFFIMRILTLYTTCLLFVILLTIHSSDRFDTFNYHLESDNLLSSQFTLILEDLAPFTATHL
jgi:uncharacterized membrane protein